MPTVTTAGWALLLDGTPVSTMTAARLLREEGLTPGDVARRLDELGKHPVPDDPIPYDLIQRCQDRRMTRLGWAARTGNLGGVVGLLKIGHDPNEGDPTPLMEAIGHLITAPKVQQAIITTLVMFPGQHGRADLNVVTSRGGTALTTVARFHGANGPDIARMLLRNGADPTRGDPEKVAVLRAFMEEHGLAAPAATLPAFTA